MSSTKRKQNKPQKIFNSKFNKSLLSELTSTSTTKNLNKISDQKVETVKKETELEKTKQEEEQEQVWRVVADLVPQPDKMKETKRNENNEKLTNGQTVRLEPALSTSSFLDNKSNYFNESILNHISNNLMQPNNAAVGLFNDGNLVQAIEKIIFMNLTPYLLGMLNNTNQQQTPQSQFIENFPNYDSYLSAFSTVKKQDSNQDDLIKESIENLFSKTDYNQTKQRLESDEEAFKKKKALEDLYCSCGLSFDSIEILTLHLKQTNHKAKVEKKQNKSKESETDDYKKIKNNKTDSPRSFNVDALKSSSCSASSSVSLSPSQSPLTNITSNKMVRGQEEWVKNSRDNNFISQILKCLECSASFDTLADLSVHMLNSNHFSKFQHHQSLPMVSSHSNAPSSIVNGFKQIDPKSADKSNKFNESIKTNQSNCYSVSSQSKQFKQKKPESPVAVFNNNGVACRLKNSIINQPELKCLICNKKFDYSSSTSTSSNDSSHHQLGIKLNEAKQQQLPPLVKLIQHLQNAHKITNVCTNCGAFFKNTDELQKHLVEESYHHHSYSHQLQNYNSSKNKQLKRTNSNSSLSVKKFKSSSETDMKRSNNGDTEATGSKNSIDKASKNEPDQQGFDFGESLKLNLLLSNKQRNENENNRYFNSKLNTNSISPSSSTSSYSYSSSNSSPPSFLFEQAASAPGLLPKEKMESHPLLALQMFVNGSMDKVPPPPPLVSITPSTPEPNRTDNLNYMSKLPAKKRPYIEDTSELLKSEMENSRSSFKQLASNDKTIDNMSGSFLISKLNCKNEENCFKRSRPSSDDLNSFTKENKKCHSPLNLLQKMQIGLDDYLMR